MWQSMKNAPKGQKGDIHPPRFVALVRRNGFERFVPVTCYWCYGLKTPRWIFNGWKTGEEPMYWMDFPDQDTSGEYDPFDVAEQANKAIDVRQGEQDRCDLIVREEWHYAVQKYSLRPGSITESAIGCILDRIRFDLEDSE